VLIPDAYKRASSPTTFAVSDIILVVFDSVVNSAACAVKVAGSVLVIGISWTDEGFS